MIPIPRDPLRYCNFLLTHTDQDDDERILTKLALSLTAGAAGEAVCVVEVSHGLAGLAGTVHTLPTLHADTWRRHKVG